jgi:hypothetical protein
MKNRPGIPKSLIQNKEAEELRLVINTICLKTVMYRELMVASGTEIQKRGKLDDKLRALLETQLRTLDTVLSSCMSVPQEGYQTFAKMIMEDPVIKLEFNKKLTETLDALCPEIIVPGGKGWF